MLENTSVKHMEKPSIAFDPLPSGRPPQEERVLAAHPPSCHPPRVFGCPESAEKMEEKCKKRRESGNGGKTGELKSSPPDLIIKCPLYKAWFWDFVVKAPLQNYKNNLTNILTIGAKRKKTKRDQKAKTKRAAGNELGRRNSGGQEEISQVLQFPCSSTFLAFSTLLSFWYLICNDEFDLNSSCLDRLNNFGTIRSQKL